MDLRLKEIVNNLAHDGISGASEMMASTLNSLLAIPENALIAIPASDWEDFSISLHRAKPSIAPVFNIANSIMLKIEQGAHGTKFLHEMLMEIRERERRSGLRIMERCDEHIEGNVFMTTSYSSTVAQVLKSLAKSRNIKVTVARASPGDEGIQFAKLLAEYEMEVELIHDSTVFARMESMDSVIVGADSVSTSGLVNKVGTRILAEAAKIFGHHAYAVCGWNKISPVVLSDLVVHDNVLERNLSEHIQYFESTPLELFSRIITDQGVLSSSDLLRDLDGREVARAWYARNVLTR